MRKIIIYNNIFHTMLFLYLFDRRYRVAVADDVSIVTPLTPEGGREHMSVGHRRHAIEAADGRHDAT